jgi:hypothetical protein
MFYNLKNKDTCVIDCRFSIMGNLLLGPGRIYFLRGHVEISHME